STTSCGPPGNTYAYLTSATNALSQTSSATFEPCTGLRASAKDPNNQITSFAYYDNMGRLNQVNYPDGGQITYCYTDTGGTFPGNGSCAQAQHSPYAIDVTKQLNASQFVTETFFLDGLGRTIQTQLSDPVAATFTATVYDSTGRL